MSNPKAEQIAVRGGDDLYNQRYLMMRDLSYGINAFLLSNDCFYHTVVIRHLTLGIACSL